MATTTAVTTATITGTQIRVEMADRYAGTFDVIFVEPRPATFADADTALAAHGLGRTGEWDLGDLGTITATVTEIDNMFNGTRAARLDQAVGTTHDEWETVLASEIRDGDLISDLELTAPYVVAGSSLDESRVKVHMVGEGQVWDQRFTTNLDRGRHVKVARRRA